MRQEITAHKYAPPMLLAHLIRDAGPGQPYKLGEQRIRPARAAGQRGRGAEAHFDQPGGKRGLNVIRRPEVLAQRASKDGGPEIARHPSRLWLYPRTSG
jgi:hypothetical protein